MNKSQNPINTGNNSEGSTQLEEENSPDEKLQCSKCGKILTEEELSDDFRFNKGTVCHECFLRFLRKKRILGEAVTLIIILISIFNFYSGQIIFGIFFTILIIILVMDIRSVANLIIEIEHKLLIKPEDKNNTFQSKE